MGDPELVGRGVLIGALALLMTSALAVDARANEEPWRAGVSAQHQEQAKTLYDQGQQLLEDGIVKQAADRFRASLALWDHPTTHFGMWNALTKLDSSAEAVRHAWAAMRHGGAPLERAQIEQLERYSALALASEVVHLVVRSERAGAVTNADAVLFQGPGTWEGLVPVGTLALAVAPKAALRVTGTAGRRVEVVFPKAGAPQSSERASTVEDLAAVQKRMVGFVVRFPTAAERRAHAEVEWQDPGDGLPAPSAGICGRATGDLRTVCQQYEADRKVLLRLQREQVAAKQEALKRLQELTKGGVADTLE